MENTKRRRGISLAHQSSACQAMQESAPTQQPVTRLQYNRYPISQSPSRHASAPKPKVTFAYVPTLENTPASPYAGYSRNPSTFTLPEQPHPHLSCRQPGRIEVRRVPTPQLRQFQLAPPAAAAEMTQQSALSAYRLSNPIMQTVAAHQVTSVSPLSTSQPVAEQPTSSSEATAGNGAGEQPLLQRYFSFEHCKESIAKRIFAGSGVSGVSSSREETHSRSNRWIEPTPEVSLPAVENKTRKQNLEIQRSVFSFVPDPKPRAVQPSSTVKEAVTQTVQTASQPAKENVAPLAVSVGVGEKEVKMEKKRRDPMKLKEMEQRLLQIIKICDENM